MRLSLLAALTLSITLSTHSVYAQTTQYEISNFVGTANGIGSADGVRGAAKFLAPAGLWGDATSLYIADGGNHTIRKMVRATGLVSTVAGAPGPVGSVDAVGAEARFSIIEGLWGDGTYLYVSDLGNRTIRRVEISSGTVTTLAGSPGVQGLTDGTGSAARFIAPGALWGDGTNLYVGDTSETARVIRRITLATGQVTTIANLTAIPGESGLLGLWGDGTNLWVADPAVHCIRKVVIATGQVTTFAGVALEAGSADGPATTARFDGPAGIWGDETNLYVADSFNGTIRQVSIATGDTRTIAGLAGEFGSADGIGPVARFAVPYTMWGTGSTLFLIDYANGTIRSINLTTTAVSTAAGAAASVGTADGTGAAAEFGGPTMIWGDGKNLYIVDTDNATIRRASLATGQVTTVAGTPGSEDTLDGIGTAAHFYTPLGITGDAQNLYVTEARQDTIRKIQLSTSEVTTFAGSATEPSGSVDGVGTAARFRVPLGIWGDGTHLYIADSSNYTIRRMVIATGQVTTFAGQARSQGTTDAMGSAARFVLPEGIWGDGTNLYVSDGHAIRKIVIATGHVTTIAGTSTTPGSSDGIGAAASFDFPVGIWGDGANLFVADSGNSTIRKIDLSTNNVTTIIGTALVPGTENGRGAAGRLVVPVGIWGDGTTIYVADSAGYNIRKISVAGAATDNSIVPFTIANRGGLSTTSSGAGASVTIGYGRIQPNSDSTPPAGLAIFGFTQGNVLVSEAAVPAAPLVRSARFYAEIGGAVNTGVAIANPNPTSATINFYFTNEAGTNFNSGTTTLAANGQTAAFLNQSPFWPSSAAQSETSRVRTFTVTSDQPISIIALRGFTNERSEFLITTLPVTELNASVSAPLIFPHFADGGGWRTQVVLVNQSDDVLTGNVQFFSQGSSTAAGQALSININGTVGTTFAYSIPARSSFKMVTSGTDSAVRVGSVRVASSGGTRTPAGLAVFSFRNAGVTVAEAGVPALAAGNAFRLYAEASGNSGQVGSIQTGFAITNNSPSSITVNIEVTTLDGASTGLNGSTTVPANGQVAMFLDQVEGLRNLPLPFRGLLRISGSGISVVGLRGRYNQRGDFLITTTPPVDEAAAPPRSEFGFAHLVDGGGYTTQFILFSGAAGLSSSGTVRFFNQAGQSLPLTLR